MTLVESTNTISSHKITSNPFEEEPNTPDHASQHSTPPQSSSQPMIKPEHTSLLVTPLNRLSGGKVQEPSPSILDKYFSKHNKIASPPLQQKTTIYNNNSTYNSNIITSDIKSRLRQITRTAAFSTPSQYNTHVDNINNNNISNNNTMLLKTMTPTDNNKGNITINTINNNNSIQYKTPISKSSSPSTFYPSRLSSSNTQTLPTPSSLPSRVSPPTTTASDKMSYYYSTTSPSSTINSNNSNTNRSRHMHAELQLKEMEVNKLASLAAETRRERDELKESVKMLTKELEYLHSASQLKGKSKTTTTSGNDNNNSNNTGDNSSQLQQQQQHINDLQQQLQSTTMQLAAAFDRAVHAETALTEERSRTEKHHAEHAEVTSLTETALAAQVKALAAQLQVAKGETIEAQQEIQRLQQIAVDRDALEKEGKESMHEELMHANRELEAALSQADDDLAACRSQLESMHATVQRLSTENHALRAMQDAHTADRTANETYQAQIDALQRELRDVKLRAVQAEDALARSDTPPAMHAAIDEHTSTSTVMVATYGPSPLRDLVGSLRSQLHDQELRVAAAEEELSIERSRNAELHQRMVDQAIELDDARRLKMEIDGLRNELMAARRAEEAAQRRSAALSQELEALKSGEGGGCERESDVVASLRQALDEKEEQVMKLQGQVRLLNSVVVEDDAALDNWLIA